MDLDYDEDSNADVDKIFIYQENGRIEVQIVRAQPRFKINKMKWLN